MSGAKDEGRRVDVGRQASEWFTRLQGGGSHFQVEFHNWLSKRSQHGWEFLVETWLDIELHRLARTSDFDTAELLRQARGEPAEPTAHAAEASRALGFKPPAAVRSRATGDSSKVVRLRRGRASRRSTPRPRPVNLRLLTTIACAGAVLVTGLSVVGRSATDTEYETAHGERRTIPLPDGSLVQMNSATHLRVRFGEQKRSIDLLAGEALFDVAHDVDRPFEVRSRDAVVRAIGTQFDVRQREDALDVLVTSGRVMFSVDSHARQAGIALKLSAGQALSLRTGVDARAAEVRAVTAREELQILDWSDGRIALMGTSLKEAAERFNRYNKTKLIIDDEKVGRFRLGGTYRISDPQHFAAALKVFGIGVRPGANGDGTLHLYRAAAAVDAVSVPSRTEAP